MNTDEDAGAIDDGDRAPLMEEIGERIGRSAGFVANAIRRGSSGITSGVGDGFDSDRSASARAEQLVNRVESGIGGLTGVAANGVRRVLARAREEYEDVRAEAEARRAGDVAGETSDASE